MSYIALILVDVYFWEEYTASSFRVEDRCSFETSVLGSTIQKTTILKNALETSKIIILI